MNELYHHGILGMKWGVRRTPEQLGHTNGEKKRSRRLSKDEREKVKRKAASDNRRTISTEELKERIERLRLEKQLKELTDEDLTPGRKFISDLMSQSGKKVVATIATGAMLYGAKAAVSKQFNAKEFGDALFNGGPKKK